LAIFSLDISALPRRLFSYILKIESKNKFRNYWLYVLNGVARTGEAMRFPFSQNFPTGKSVKGEQDLLLYPGMIILVKYSKRKALDQGMRLALHVKGNISKILAPIEKRGADHCRPRRLLSDTPPQGEKYSPMKTKRAWSQEMQPDIFSILRNKDIHV
jgi:hypothetical protein